MFKLVIQDDEGKTTVVPLIRDEITIGRKEGNTIRLTERNVSRRHARIVRSNGAVAIEDLGSYNGVRVNGTRIAQRTSLSVSDRVQIGDYLIELKAEGVESVTDDGKTQPIERMDPNFIEAQMGQPLGTAPTLPPAVPGAPGHPGAPPPGVHALADTDPAARAIAAGSPLAAAPLGMGTVGNARLVVLSSNFAGQEFELVRPQMIIGRTDDNDIVVNHRSISRNHAKVVREADTGRYTISDLQSSNGVRVNGEEYGKVELRRGDVVDLGHVRLRFIEPGEDFVFGRDAQIADVPTGGRSKGLMIAAAVALLAIGAIAVVMLTRGPKEEGKKIVTPADKSDARTIAQDTTPDGAMAVVPVGPDTPKLEECRKLRNVDKPDWAAIQKCAKDVGPTGADLARQATEELANQIRLTDIEEAARKKDHQGLQTRLKDIKPDSIYYERAQALGEALKKEFIEDEVAAGRRLADKKDCRTLRQRADQVEKIYKDAGAALRAIPCATSTASNDPDPPRPECSASNPCGGGKECKSGKCVTVSTPEPSCSADEAEALVGEARQAGGANQWSKMLQKAEASIKCKSSKQARQLALMAACRLGDKSKAQKYWKEFENNTGMRQICINTIGE
jgi:pSer/pThr/pTyr-binding forkhead associated (FHA) protein